MFKAAEGEIYHLSGGSYPDRYELLRFFLDGHMEDIIAFHKGGDTVHISYHDVQYNNREYLGNYVTFGPNMFYEASVISSGLPQPFSRIPVINEEGDYVSILEYVPTPYCHQYAYQGGIDTSVLDLYECICLHGVNEFSYEICCRCLDDWAGTLILCGQDWKEFLDILPRFSPRIRVLFDYEMPEGEMSRITAYVKTLQLHTFHPGWEDSQKRIRQELYYYDEIMTLLFCFAQEEHLGEENPGEKFFLIDADFAFQGLISILNVLLEGAAYAQCKGYTPVFQVVSSGRSIYSDYPQEDIWGKFFSQPGKYGPEDITQSNSVTFSPNFNLTNPCTRLMELLVPDMSLEFGNVLFNTKLQRYIQGQADALLPEPQKTLGVLIRGTDYAKTKPTGHAIQADVEMVIRKIYELETAWQPYPYIYLATEDADILTRMKQEFGKRLLYTGQGRSRLGDGESFLCQQKGGQTVNGYQKGADYLAALHLLSRCDSLLASGNCSGTGAALLMNRGAYRHQYIFELGFYP